MEITLFLSLLFCFQTVFCDEVIIETPLGLVRGFETFKYI